MANYSPSTNYQGGYRSCCIVNASKALCYRWISVWGLKPSCGSSASSGTVHAADNAMRLVGEHICWKSSTSACQESSGAFSRSQRTPSCTNGPLKSQSAIYRRSGRSSMIACYGATARRVWNTLEYSNRIKAVNSTCIYFLRVERCMIKQSL